MRVSDAASAVGSVSPIREHPLTIPNHQTDWSDSRICWLAALAVSWCRRERQLVATGFHGLVERPGLRSSVGSPVCWS